MKVTIVGAGAVGSQMAKLLAQYRQVEEVHCIDRNLSRARAYRSDKVILHKGNAGKPGDIRKWAKHSDLLINASLPQFNLAIMKLALELNCHYQDLAANMDWDRSALAACPYKIEQLTMDARFQKAGKVGLINTGAAPGMTDLLAAEAASRFRRVDCMHIRLFEDLKSREFISSWSKEFALDEMASQPLTYERGRYRLHQKFAGEEIFDYPGIGERYAYLVAQDEAATIPRYIKTGLLDVKAGGREIDNARAFYKIGLLGGTSISIDGTRVAPYRVLEKLWPETPTPEQLVELVTNGTIRRARFAVAVEAYGTRERGRAGEQLSIIFPDQKELLRRAPGATYISYPTALCAVLFAVRIPKLNPGVYPAEAIDAESRASILAELQRRGIRIRHKDPRPRRHRHSTK